MDQTRPDVPEGTVADITHIRYEAMWLCCTVAPLPHVAFVVAVLDGLGWYWEGQKPPKYQDGVIQQIDLLMNSLIAQAVPIENPEKARIWGLGGLGGHCYCKLFQKASPKPP